MFVLRTVQTLLTYSFEPLQWHVLEMILWNSWPNNAISSDGSRVSVQCIQTLLHCLWTEIQHREPNNKVNTDKTINIFLKLKTTIFIKWQAIYISTCEVLYTQQKRNSLYKSCKKGHSVLSNIDDHGYMGTQCVTV